METSRFIVSGRVQGVGFRAYVRATAEELGVLGGVWNTREGNVEAIASHESEEVLGVFERRLWQGPGFVSEVRRTKGLSLPIGTSFEVWQTR